MSYEIQKKLNCSDTNSKYLFHVREQLRDLETTKRGFIRVIEDAAVTGCQRM